MKRLEPLIPMNGMGATVSPCAARASAMDARVMPRRRLRPRRSGAAGGGENV
ncbi:hypothetical protein JDY09_03555 [Thermoleophilum album]|uniref:hypothetical protein n=1 Tax=Thermoleophilum album TaxID=29539 RepID=UPI00237CC7F1|nr:hypothetical protein [Thermoleophilum album]WDT94337.1 hypothetical protein JDY09_03555 [Thermoleophilum album]